MLEFILTPILPFKWYEQESSLVCWRKVHDNKLTLTTQKNAHIHTHTQWMNEWMNEGANKSLKVYICYFFILSLMLIKLKSSEKEITIDFN